LTVHPNGNFLKRNIRRSNPESHLKGYGASLKLPSSLSAGQKLQSLLSNQVTRTDISACVPKVDHKLPNYVVVDAVVACHSSAPKRKSIAVAVYDTSDIVSSQIRQTGNWDPEDTKRISDALWKASSTRAASNGTMIDIGANIGWFTLHMAACGHNVVAFEPFEENVALLQMSICLNGLQDKVELFKNGLGTQDATCELASFQSNHGDAIVLCDQKRKARWAINGKPPSMLGKFQMRQLDSLLERSRAASGPVDVLKIDVEGYELPALKGGLSFLRNNSRAPPLIFSEYSVLMMDNAGNDPEKYLQMLLDLGYRICPINGPRRGMPLTQQQIRPVVDSVRADPGNHIWDIVAHKPQSGFSECRL